MSRMLNCLYFDRKINVMNRCIKQSDEIDR